MKEQKLQKKIDQVYITHIVPKKKRAGLIELSSKLREMWSSILTQVLHKSKTQ